MNASRVFKIFLLITVILSAELTFLFYMFPPGPAKHPHPPDRSSKSSHRQDPIPDKAPDQAELQSVLLQLLGEDVDLFSIYLLRPQKERLPILHQSRKPMRSASMIKVFILAKAMQDIKDGKHALDETIVLRERDMVAGAGILPGMADGTKLPLSKVMELMITESDNTATNILIDLLGMEEINAYIKASGYSDTILQHKMMISNAGRKNLTSAEDLGNLFTRIYRHQCVDPYYDDLMIQYLLDQEDRECFPSALPHWQIAHKTGEVDLLYDDGGIFYGREEDFILVILDDNYSSRFKTIERMRRIASMVANGFM